VLIAAAGHRVGVIDTDIQSPGIHVLFARPAEAVEHSLNDYLYGRCRIEQAACDVTASAIGRVAPGQDRPRLFLIPSSIETGAIAKVLREGYDVALLNEGFEQLSEKLRLDYLLIDTHPGVNEETLLSIAVSDLFLLILRPDNQDFQGTSVTVELARRLEVREILVVLNKAPSTMDRDLLRAQVESAYGAAVIGVLPLSEEVAQLASAGLFVNRYPEHPLTRELRRIAQRIMT
jgi:MinD-like ATPase involved in chromosome partitioning or flagellar assembly